MEINDFNEPHEPLDDVGLARAVTEPGEESLEAQGEIVSDGMRARNAATGEVYQNAAPATVRPGDEGPTVKFMQARLNRNGANLTVDGRMSSRSEEEVKRLQQNLGLAADGIVGRASWNCLLNGSARIVAYRQRDPKWRDVKYSIRDDPRQTIGSGGCGPTSLAIALSAFGVRAEPPELCAYALKHGHRTPNSGTAYSFFSPAAAHYGCRASALPSAARALESLSAGLPVIASMRPGDYTSNGHYICVRDYDPYNEIFYTIDPYNATRNSCSKQVIMKQGKAFWVIDK